MFFLCEPIQKTTICKDGYAYITQRQYVRDNTSLFFKIIKYHAKFTFFISFLKFPHPIYKWLTNCQQSNGMQMHFLNVSHTFDC